MLVGTLRHPLRRIRNFLGRRFFQCIRPFTCVSISSHSQFRIIDKGSLLSLAGSIQARRSKCALVHLAQCNQLMCRCRTPGWLRHSQESSSAFRSLRDRAERNARPRRSQRLWRQTVGPNSAPTFQRSTWPVAATAGGKVVLVASARPPHRGGDQECNRRM